ncbi:MAG: LUD domain-containing protein [Bacteroidales bacterium]|nr:LUD domain-containing protein [Bacteroidales bacterium]
MKVIKKNSPEFKPLPEQVMSTRLKSTEELKEIFKRNLKIVGADSFEFNRIEDVASYLEVSYPGALDFGKKEVWDEYPSSCQKERLDKLKTVVLEGQFGVAENGAIWLDDSNFPNRLIPFIVEHLIIKLDSHKIVESMNEAYCRLNLNDIGFGVFISGPSKTADIEQNLVYGAHGAKELSVFLY